MFQTIHLVTMSATENMASHQADNSQNYITVIPVEYPRSRVYSQPPGEYLVDRYRWLQQHYDRFMHTELQYTITYQFSVFIMISINKGYKSCSVDLHKLKHTAVRTVTILGRAAAYLWDNVIKNVKFLQQGFRK